MLYEPKRTPRGATALDARFDHAKRDVTEVLGEGWWRYKRKAKETELLALLSNLAACLYDHDKFDELSISRDKSDYGRLR